MRVYGGGRALRFSLAVGGDFFLVGVPICVFGDILMKLVFQTSGMDRLMKTA